MNLLLTVFISLSYEFSCTGFEITGKTFLNVMLTRHLEIEGNGEVTEEERDLLERKIEIYVILDSGKLPQFYMDYFLVLFKI